MPRALAVAMTFALSLSLLAPVAASAATAPPNDNFADATWITGLPSSDSVDIGSATAESGEPNPGLCPATRSRTVWYKVTPASTGAVFVDPAGSTIPNLTLTAYRLIGTGALQYAICTKSLPTISFNVQAGATYYVQASNDGSGSGDLDVAFSFISPPPNDNFAAASPVESFPASDSVDIRGGTSETSEIKPCPMQGIRTVWYRITSRSSGSVTADATDSTFPTAKLAAYVSDGPGFAGLTNIACNGSTPSMTFDVRADETYYVQASDATGTYSGVVNIDFTFAPDMTAPVLTLPSDITAEATGPSGAAVTYAVSALDAVDGSRPVTCSSASGSSFALGETTVNCFATDTTGNVASGSFLVSVVDTTAPVVTFTGAHATYTVAETVGISCSATDAVGVASDTCVDIAGPASGLGLGSHTYGATATDAAGNVGSGSTTFVVVVTYPSLSSLTRQWVWKAGVARDLAALLDSAERAHARGQLQAEASKLADYRALLLAQAGKSITRDQAQLLITFSYGL